MLLFFPRRFMLVMRSSCYHKGASLPWRIFSAFFRYDAVKELGSLKTAPEDMYPKAGLARFSQSTEGLISALHPKSFEGSGKSAGAAAPDLFLVEVDVKCPRQVPLCSWHLYWTFSNLSLACVDCFSRCKELKSARFHLYRIFSSPGLFFFFLIHLMSCFTEGNTSLAW